MKNNISILVTTLAAVLIISSFYFLFTHQTKIGISMSAGSLFIIGISKIITSKHLKILIIFHIFDF